MVSTTTARYLEDCLKNSEYWDAPVDQLTEQTAPAQMLGFLESVR